MSLLDTFKYPAVNFHFAVTFELFPQTPNDLRFQEVSGLTVDVETTSYAELGQNRFKHALPVRSNHGQLVLKRGVFIGSGLVYWFRKAVEDFEFKPTNVLISLLNEYHIPIAAWYVVHAIPVGWETGGFSSEDGKVAVETMKLNYRYFNTIRI